MRQYISVKHSPVFDFKSPSRWDFSTLCFLKARPFAAQSSFSKLIANFVLVFMIYYLYRATSGLYPARNE